MAGPMVGSKLVGLRVSPTLPVVDVGAVVLTSLPSTSLLMRMGATVERLGVGLYVGDCVDRRSVGVNVAGRGLGLGVGRGVDLGVGRGVGLGVGGTIGCVLGRGVVVRGVGLRVGFLVGGGAKDNGRDVGSGVDGLAVKGLGVGRGVGEGVGNFVGLGLGRCVGRGVGRGVGWGVGRRVEVWDGLWVEVLVF